MPIDVEVLARVLAPAASALVTAFIKRFAEARATLTSYVGNVSTFELSDENRTRVFTHSLFLQNSGRKSVENVRVVHNFLPSHVYVHPRTEHTISIESGEILIPRLVPKESITISYLYHPPLTCGQVHQHVKSDLGFAKTIDVVTIVRPSLVFRCVLVALCFVGASYLFYWMIKLVLYLTNL